jgi:hypothetical protein
MSTLEQLDISFMSQMDDEALLRRLLEIRRQRRITPARKKAKKESKKAAKADKDLIHLLGKGADPDDLQALIDALEAKIK